MNFSKKLFLILFAFFIFCGNTYSQNDISDKEIRADLIGVWQDSSSVGSGMSDNFQFFSNGRYRFNYNSMDGTKRLLYHSGFWKVSSGKLVLKLRKVSLLVGGKWVRSSGSIATEYEIEGGRVIEKSLSSKENVKLDLSDIIKEEFHKTINIDGVKYWKMSANPKAYEN